MALRSVATLLALVGWAGVAIVATTDGNDHPLANAHEGQWVLRKTTATTPDATRTSYTYERVGGVLGHMVQLMSQPVAANGLSALGPETETVVDTSARRPPEPAAKISEEEMAVMGNTIACRRVEAIVDDGSDRSTHITWTSREVPLGGLVKERTLDGHGNEVSRIELIEFGESGGSARPTLAAPPGQGWR